MGGGPHGGRGRESSPLTLPMTTDTAAHRTISCLVVDDHPAIRAGLRDLLATEPGFAVVAALETAEAAAEFARVTEFDVAIVDYQLSGHSGLWLSRKLKRLQDPPAVLVYSAFSDYLLAAACVVAEADGLLSKAALGRDLYERIREVAGGERRLPMVPPALAESMRHRLDPEEQAIYGLLLAGIPADEICRTLGIADIELETRQGAMLRKLERLDK
jgi:DNA-binding NarL/FixJ family response regulator